MPVDPVDRPPRTGWKRQPLSLWVFLALGIGRIILSGVDLVLFGRKR